jgi:hypothetical protein
VRNERRTPGLAKGIRKPAAATRWRASDAHSLEQQQRWCVFIPNVRNTLMPFNWQQR